MNQQKKPRSSNFELLRITAMLMIISYHIFFHCISAQMTYPESPFTVPVVFKKLVILNTIAQFGNIGNALFLILSGFFMIRKGKNIEIGKTAFKLLTQLGFSVIVLIFASMAADFLYPHDNISLFGIDHFNGGSWYIGYYFMVIVLAFLLPEFFSCETRQESIQSISVNSLCLYSVYLVLQSPGRNGRRF